MIPTRKVAEKKCKTSPTTSRPNHKHLLLCGEMGARYT